MSKKRSVFFIVNCIEFFISHRFNLATAAVADGMQVAVVAPDTRPLESREKDAGFAKYGISWQTLSYDVRRLSLINVLRTVLHGFSLGLRNRESIFHLVTIVPILLYGIPLRILNRRLVVAVSGFGTAFNSNQRKYRILRPLISSLYRAIMNGKNSTVIVQNHEDQATLVSWGVHSEQIKLIRGSGADPAYFSFAPKAELGRVPGILVPARLLIDKGIIDACEASAHLQRLGFEHRIFFAGSISTANPTSLTESQVNDLSTRYPSVRFLGKVSNMLELFNQCDIVCLPSYHEGLPKALVEAFAVGRPVVAYDTRGCRELVIDQKTGLLARLRDPADLARALADLLQDQGLRDRLTANAYQFFLQHLTVEQVTCDTLSIYRLS